MSCRCLDVMQILSKITSNTGVLLHSDMLIVEYMYVIGMCDCT